MEKDHPTLGWYYNLYMDPKERVPTTMTWANAAVPEPSAGCSRRLDWLWSGDDRDEVELHERWNGASRTTVVWCSLRHSGCPVTEPDFERGWRISFGA